MEPKSTSTALNVPRKGQKSGLEEENTQDNADSWNSMLHAIFKARLGAS